MSPLIALTRVDENGKEINMVSVEADNIALLAPTEDGKALTVHFQTNSKPDQVFPQGLRVMRRDARSLDDLTKNINRHKSNQPG